MHSAQERSTAEIRPSAENRRRLILTVWLALMVCVVISSLLPQTSPVMEAVNRHINDKLLHFCAYAALSLLPVVGFRSRRMGLVAGFSMFLLGILIEGAQHFSPGRSTELGDLIANSAGVSCGLLFAPPRRSGLRSRHSRSIS